uniref:Protein shisa-5 n=1 Tax=Panagrellus redivivus TaxID=6233 RepID=A0A7E4UVQ1_PANRE
MGCDCIPPPPEFDLPPPPDPSLIWHLISDEPSDALRKIRLQSCEFNPLFEFFGLDGLTLEAILFFGLACAMTVLFTVCSVTLIWWKCCQSCSGNRPKRVPSSDSCNKLNSSSSTIVTSSVIPQWSTTRSPPQVLMSSASANTLRSVPKMGTQGYHYPRPTTYRLPADQPSAYCTLNQHYEEIPINYALPPAVSIPVSRSHAGDAMLYLDQFAATIERRPPPRGPPPPPPPPQALLDAQNNQLNQSRTSSDDIDGSSIDAEIEVINARHAATNGPSPVMSGGRESGYGTGPSRLWHHAHPGSASPRIPSFKDTRTPETSPPAKLSAPALTVYGEGDSAPMTYV